MVSGEALEFFLMKCNHPFLARESFHNRGDVMVPVAPCDLSPTDREIGHFKIPPCCRKDVGTILRYYSTVLRTCQI